MNLDEGLDRRYWARVEVGAVRGVKAGYYWDLEIAADPDVERIMLRAQGNLTREGYWRDVATDLARLVDELREKLAKLEVVA